MPVQTSSNRKSEVELVGERVTRTKKEIEQLKAQLEKLISDGMKKGDAAESKGEVDPSSNASSKGALPLTCSEVSANKAKNSKDNIADIMAPRQPSCSVVPVKHTKPVQKQDKEEVSPKKVRHYDQEAAREYIKKQKEKRREMMKSVKKETTTALDLKKQRLQELREKSLQLLSKNVQHKRERSRSRSRSRSRTRENDQIDNISKSKVTQRSEEAAHPQLKNITVRSNLRATNGIAILDVPKHIQLDAIKEQSNEDVAASPAVCIDLNGKSAHEDSLEEQQKAAIKIQAALRGYQQRKSYQQTLKMQQQQASKEVQTSELGNNDIPAWLQVPAAQPYPYNFISTVKRKLNLAVQQAAIANVNIPNLLPKNMQPQSEENSHNSKHVDLKSFLSHKCLDLDVKSLEPLVLTRHSTTNHEKPSNLANSQQNGYLSDSDTSKNIPDISSESGTTASSKQHSSKRIHSSDETDHDQKLNINIEKVKKLRLLRPKRLNFNAAAPDSVIEAQLSDTSKHLTNSSHSSRKDSIIASNKCSYVQKRESVSTNINVTSSKCSGLQKASEELPSPKPQDSLSSFHSYMRNLKEDFKTSGKTQDMEISEINLQNSAGTGNSSRKSSTRQTSLKTPTEVSTANSVNSIKVGSSSRKSENSSKNSEQLSLKALSEGLRINKGKTGKEKVSSEMLQQSANSDSRKDYSSNFASATSTSLFVPLLKRPSISLQSSHRVSSSESVNASDEKLKTNITLRPGERTSIESKVKSNEIHLKFEAELHLLNEFNDSLRQVMAIEKSLLELHNNKQEDTNRRAAVETRDTQTSFLTKSSESLRNVPSTVNYSRGSEISEHMNIFGSNNSSLVTTGLELSQLKDNELTSSIEESNVDVQVSLKENYYNGNIHAGISLDMFEQLIKDEDARIENLKTILKLREKALVDRTKGELAWLEIQKKHLRDSGQLQEISAIKKKQRGLLIKLEHERHEMQRLKQMQKAASKERKSVLREQRNIIKVQLSNASNMITKIKRNTREERRHSGPLKVYNIRSHNESVRSETSMSKRSSVAEEVVSVVSCSHSVISHVTEEVFSSSDVTRHQHRSEEIYAAAPVNSHVQTEHVKRSLLMREAALQKRRQAAEELLQWHQRLVEEEAKIAELEKVASAIVSQVPATAGMVSDEPAAERHQFKGSQLNLLWHNMTGREESRFNDNATYSMSSLSLERFCRDARRYSLGQKAARYSDSDSSSIIRTDIGASVLEGKYKPKGSHGEKVKKRRSKSSRLSDAPSQTIVRTSRSKDSQISDYTSDFESANNEVTLSDEEEIATIAEKSRYTNNKIVEVVNGSSPQRDIKNTNETTPSKIIQLEIVDRDATSKDVSSDIVDDDWNNCASEDAKIAQQDEAPTTLTANDSQLSLTSNKSPPIVDDESCAVVKLEESQPSCVVTEESAVQPSNKIEEPLNSTTNELVTQLNETTHQDQLPSESLQTTNERQTQEKSPTEKTHSSIPREASTEDLSPTTSKNVEVEIVSEVNEDSLIIEEIKCSNKETEDQSEVLISEEIKYSIKETEDQSEVLAEKISEISEIKTVDEEAILSESNQTDNDKLNIDSTEDVDDKSKSNSSVNCGYINEEAKRSITVEVESGERRQDTTNKTDEKIVDVKKRVSEILADANIPSPRGDKSPRVQDLYVTAYDVLPEQSPESGSPTDEREPPFPPVPKLYGSDEVEELLKKQLEIEQEIKEIQQQQQKEHIPYLYVREIPNKPPPPYTPPATTPAPVTGSILPASEKQVDAITATAAHVLHAAYLDKNLSDATLSVEHINELQVDKSCCEFVFDLCKEAAVEHYQQFETETGPTWMHLSKICRLAMGKPLDRSGLEQLAHTKVRQWLGYETVKAAENLKRKWSGKKRDHVDELLVVECQAEEADWTHYDRDELVVKDELIRNIMNMLLSETAQVFNGIFEKKNVLSNKI